MVSDRMNELEALFHDALKLTPQERVAFLEKSCANDPELKAEVESLIEAHKETHNDLPEPAWVRFIHTSSKERGDLSELEVEPDLPFDRLGEFRLIRRWGEGGMGVVYLAVQEPMNRQVALKVIRPERMGSFEAAARFQREVDAISKVNHPNIVTVYGSGEDRDVHYFAMELVPGRRMDEVLREALSQGEKIPTPKILGWIREIAEALVCAHQTGIIHRDVKPSNILITSEEHAKLFDFGIARHMELTTLTLTGEFRGTPHYASPEQVKAVQGQKVDVPADIYSLGVTLYEAVTGRVPYIGETTEQVFQQILEGEPISPRRLNPAISKDLETVILKAMEKEVERRYVDMWSFAEDLRRVQEGEVILAKPVGLGTKLWKRVRRNPALSGASLFIIVLIAFIPWIFVMKESEKREAAELAQREIEKQRNEAIKLKNDLERKGEETEQARRRTVEAKQIAEEQAEKADREAKTAQAALDFMVELFKSSNPAEVLGKIITAQDILNRGIKNIKNDLKEQPRIRCVLLSTLGAICKLLGQYREAEPLLEEALEIRRSILGHDDPETLGSMNDLAVLYRARGRYEEAEQLLLNALEISQRVMGDDDPGTLDTMNNLGNLYMAQGRYREVEPLYLKALETRHRTLGGDDPDTLSSMNNLANLYKAQGRNKKAESLYIEAIDLGRSNLGIDHPLTLICLNNLGFLYRLQGRYGEAEPIILETLEFRKQVLGNDHPDTITSMNNLANLYIAQGRYEEAEQICSEVIEKRQSHFGENHQDTLNSMNSLALLYNTLGRIQEAEQLLSKVLEKQRHELGDDHDATLISKNNLAGFYCLQNRHEKAEALFIEVLELRRNKFRENHPDILTSMNNLAFLYRDQGRYDEAESLFIEVIEKRRRELGDNHPDTLTSMHNLALIYFYQNRFDEAEPLFVEVLEKRRSVIGDHPDTLNLIHDLAALYGLQGNYQEAEPLFMEALEKRKRALGSEDPATLNSMYNLTVLYWIQGRYSEAEPYAIACYSGHKARFGETDPNTKDKIDLIIKIYDALEKPEKAAEYRALLTSLEEAPPQEN